MLQKECVKACANIRLDQNISDINQRDTGFVVNSNLPEVNSKSVVLATGGLSIPKIVATGFGYQIAQKFGLTKVSTRPR